MTEGGHPTPQLSFTGGGSSPPSSRFPRSETIVILLYRLRWKIGGVLRVPPVILRLTTLRNMPKSP